MQSTSANPSATQTGAAQHPIVAVGEVLWDLLPNGPRLGGTTANFAILSARLGGSSALVSCVGEDELGRRASGGLRNIAQTCGDRLDLRFIQSTTAHPTGTVSVELDPTGHPRYTIHEPVAWDVIQATPQVLELAGLASVICFGTLAQREETTRATIRGMVEAASADCTMVCDLNLRMPFCTEEALRWSLSQAHIIKVSDEELPEVARLLGDPGIAAGMGAPDSPRSTHVGAASSAAHRLLAMSPKSRMVAVTLGKHGSLLVTRTQEFRHSGFPITTVDTVGAGDAFTAGLVYAYLRGASLKAMSDVANRCGSFVAGQAGATPELPRSFLQLIEASLEA